MTAPAKALPPKAEYLVPGTRIGSYVVLDLVGRGGFGTLYKVERDGLVFALKISHQSMQDAGVESDFDGRSRNEVAALLSLRHPNVVEVVGFGRWPNPKTGYPYIVMDFVEGLHLLDWRRETVPSLRSILRVFRKLSLAVAEMHRLELFHRDLKSENILVRSSDEEPVIVDFGVSRSKSSPPLTALHHVVGTYSHLSPEFCEYCASEPFVKGERFELKPTVEIHTLGFMLYQAVTGRAPYKVDVNDLAKVLLAIATTIPQRPVTLNPYLPEGVDSLIGRLLEKDPAARPQTADALASELAALEACEDPSWDKPFDVPLARSRSTTGSSPKPLEGEPTKLLSLTPQAAGNRPQVQADAKGGAVTADLVPKNVQMSQEAAQTASFVPPTDERPAFQETNRPGTATEGTQAKLAAMRERYASMVTRTRSVPMALWVAGGICLFFLLVVSVVASGGKREDPRPHSLLASLDKPSSILPAAQPLSDRPGSTQLPEPRRDEVPIVFRGAPRSLGAPRPTSTLPQEQEPTWLLRPKPVEASRKRSPPAKSQKLGVPYGTHLRARLRTNLDSRTVGLGTMEATLIRPTVVGGTVVLPAQTRLFGQARSSGDRFTVTFDRLRLPSNTEFVFRGRAEDPGDENKPGIPPTRRIIGERRPEPGVASKVAQGTAKQLLSQVTGDTGRDVARGAGETVLDGSPQELNVSRDELFLDAGTEFGVFVEESF